MANERDTARDRIDKADREITSELRAEAARRKIKVSDLSRRTGIPASTLSEKFSDKYPLSAGEFLDLCMAMNANPVSIIEVAFAKSLAAQLTQSDVALVADSSPDEDEHRDLSNY